MCSKGNLHLTPATSEIQLRPQLHHLDATTEQERLARPRDTTSQGQGLGGVGKDGSAPGQPPAPKAIHMTIKSTSNNDQTTTETMADRLRHVQTESWQKLQYVGAEDQEAWDLYNKTLMYQTPTSQAVEAKDGKGKGKALVDDPADLKMNALRLQTQWAEEDFLHAVAGKDRDSILEGYGSTALPGIKPGDVVEDVKKEELDDNVRKAPAGSKAKGKATATTKAAATTKRAPVKGKGNAKSNAMEID
jgi:DNA-directed RNA polymerase-3 subunit RPC5